MGVNWAAGLIRWRPHVCTDGRTYSLAHLHPSRFTCELPSSARQPARTVTISVGFALHVFTCEFANAAPSPEEYRDDRERRAFDYGRYNGSLHLGELVRGLETRKCFFAKNKNFFTTEMACAPAGHEYRVFFNVRPDKPHANSVILIVQSAYFARRDVGPRDLRRQPVGFRVILSNALTGRPLHKPP